jgi:hypothetical protein
MTVLNPLYIYHQRYSTNTFLQWWLACSPSGPITARLTRQRQPELDEVTRNSHGIGPHLVTWVDEAAQ